MKKKYLVLKISKESTLDLLSQNKLYEELVDFFFYEDVFIYSQKEFFVDITNYQELYKKTPYQIAQYIKQNITQKYNIKIKIGIGDNLFLAKTACDIISKKKKTEISFLDEKEYILTCSKHKPLSDFWQISNSMMLKLKKMKIYTMEDIRNFSYKKLYETFGYNAEYLINHSLGIEGTTIKDLNTNKLPNAISVCSQFPTFKTKKESRQELIELLDFNILKLQENGLYAKNIYLYIKYANNVIPKETIIIRLKNGTNSYLTLMNLTLKKYNEEANLFIPIEKLAISFGKLSKIKESSYTIYNKTNPINTWLQNVLNKNNKLIYTIRQKMSFLNL